MDQPAPVIPAPTTFADLARLGGNARAKKLGKRRRKEIAVKANKARWGK